MNTPDPTPRLVRKLRRRTSILTEAEVALLAAHMRELMGAEFAGLLDRVPGRVEDGIRWGVLAAKCEAERLKRGWSLKDAAAELRVARYRLDAIEKGRWRELRPEIAQRYFALLAMGPWVRRWAKANHDLASRAGIAAGPP